MRSFLQIKQNGGIGMGKHTLFRKLEMFWGLPIFCVNESEGKIKSFGSFSEQENPLANAKELVQQLIETAKQQEIPVIYKMMDKIYFICIKSEERYYMTGPVCVEQISFVEIHQFYKKCHMTQQERRHPVRMTLNKLLNFVSFFYEFLEQKDVTIEELMKVNSLIEDNVIQEKIESLQMEIEKQEEVVYHHTYMEERYVMDCIREGNVVEVNERANGLLEKAGVLSKNKFNDQRNLAIVSTTMATREAIAGGVSPAEAYKLSDILINKIDQCKKIEEVVELNRKSLYKFTKLVADTKEKINLSNYTEQCKDYISKNYHHKIYLEDIADAIGISQGHLARVFKKDTGVRIQDYILEFRIERASNLLKYSDASISEISDYVCFHSQSHFGSVFKQYMKMTPKQYREKYKQKEFYGKQ